MQIVVMLKEAGIDYLVMQLMAYQRGETIKNRMSSTTEAEKSQEKEKAIPKDGQVMISILKDMGITEYEPRVIQQMLEYSYRYATTLLEDARMYSQHAKKKTVDVEDIKLSVSMQAQHHRPPRHLLLQLAHHKNLVQLPQPPSKHGLRLPPDRHCLTSCNYRLARNTVNNGQPFNIIIQPGYTPADNNNQ